MARAGDDSADVRRELVRRFYEEVWNRWDEAAARTILTPAFEFRGSLARSTHGIEAFLAYLRRVRGIFPDFHNEIVELTVGEGEPCVAARLRFTGTHRGELLGLEPTGRAIEYDGAAFLRSAGGRLVSAWVLGDLNSLLEQLRG